MARIQPVARTRSRPNLEEQLQKAQERFYADLPIKPVAYSLRRNQSLSVQATCDIQEAFQKLDDKRDKTLGDDEAKRLKERQKGVQKMAKRIRSLREAGKRSEAIKLANVLFLSGKAREVAVHRAMNKHKSTDVGNLELRDQLMAQLRDESIVLEDIRVSAKPKEDGRYRVLSDFGLLERARQELVVLSYGGMASFHPKQAGVPGRGMRDAFEIIQTELKTHRWEYAAEVDVPDCFSNVDTTQIEDIYGIPQKLVEQVLCNPKKGDVYRNINPLNGHARRNWSLIGRLARRGLPQGSSASAFFTFGILATVMRAFENEWGDRISLVNYCDNFLILGHTEDDVRMAIESLASLLAMRMVNVNSLHNDRGIRRLAEGVEFIRHEIKCNNVDPIIRVSGSYISAFLNDIRRRFDELCDCERRRILGNSRMEAESQQLEAWLLRRLPRFKNSLASYDELRVMGCIDDFLEVCIYYMPRLEKYLRKNWPKTNELQANSMSGQLLTRYTNF